MQAVTDAEVAAFEVEKGGFDGGGGGGEEDVALAEGGGHFLVGCLGWVCFDIRGCCACWCGVKFCVAGWAVRGVEDGSDGSRRRCSHLRRCFYCTCMLHMPSITIQLVINTSSYGLQAGTYHWVFESLQPTMIGACEMSQRWRLFDPTCSLDPTALQPSADVEGKFEDDISWAYHSFNVKALLCLI